MVGKKKIVFLFLGGLLLVSWFMVFGQWFSLGVISAGDLGFFFPINIQEYWQWPLSWESFRNSGLGGYAIPFQHMYLLNLPWGIWGHFLNFVLIERLVWFWPIICLGVFDVYLWTKYLKLPVFFSFFVWLFLLLNTYFLMLVSGGQITVVFGYLVFFLTFVLFLGVISAEKLKWRKIVCFSWSLSFLLAMDPRFAYLFLLAAFGYFFFEMVSVSGTVVEVIIKYLKIFIPASLITITLHFYWLFPLIIMRRVALPVGYEKSDWVEFLSFANFSNAFSLLHANWPENIFGKIYFFRSEFLIIPILAYSSLFFIKKNKNVLFFSLLGLMGAFLAKGANPPFGWVYSWLFVHLPGMNMFRDPLKFYTWVVLSYTVLIPIALTRLYRVLKTKNKTFFPELLLIIITLFLLNLIKPAIFGKVGGTLTGRKVPESYLVLANFLENKKEFFRTLWLPKKQRFGFYANNHPAIDSESFLTDTVCREPFCSLKTKMPEKWGENCSKNDRCFVKELSYLLNPRSEEVFSQMGVKYLIIPEDVYGEIFIKERQYDQRQREEVERFLDTISWLKKVFVTQGIAVYETKVLEDRFFLTKKDVNQITDWQMINPTRYLVSLNINEVPTNLVFSESYDPFWQMKIGGEVVDSQPDVSNLFSTFIIDHQGKLELTVEYAVQKYVYYGLIISILGFLSSALLLGR